MIDLHLKYFGDSDPHPSCTKLRLLQISFYLMFKLLLFQAPSTASSKFYSSIVTCYWLQLETAPRRVVFPLFSQDDTSVYLNNDGEAIPRPSREEADNLHDFSGGVSSVCLAWIQ